jgi:uncharacterized lipoprotein YbaY
MQTLLLDTQSWDIVTDVTGNIAVASNPYSLAQDAASAIKTFEGEVWYSSNYGIPYWTQILGHAPPITLMKAAFNQAALTVPQVATSVTYLTGWAERRVSGQVQITSTTGQPAAANF